MHIYIVFKFIGSTNGFIVAISKSIWIILNFSIDNKYEENYNHL